MGGVIDTNVLLYAANRDAPEHPTAHQFLTEQVSSSSESWYLTLGVAYEFLRVSTHPKVFSAPLSAQEGIRFLDAFFQASNIEVLHPTPRHWTVLRDEIHDFTHPSGNLFFDIRTYVLMREHGVRRIYTTDTDFLQFADLEVINPLRNRRA